MNKTWKHSIFALGVVCGIAVAPEAFAAQGYMTAEQDEAIQRAGREYNRQYDLKHGYTNYAAPKRTVAATRREYTPAQQQASVPQLQAPTVRRPQKMVQDRRVTVDVDKDVMPVKRVTNAREQRQQARQNNEQMLRQRQNLQAQGVKRVAQPQRAPQQVQNVRQQQMTQQLAPRKPQERRLTKPEWMKPRVFNDYNDMQMQNAGLMYNMKFDAGIGRR